MCGINGIAFTENSHAVCDRATIESMRDQLVHRGPDDCGLFVDANIALGHRRLSIVDVAGGAQPMTNETGNLVIVFNGEIYNHADYRSWLESRRHTYRTHCDTETIVHLYEEYGARCVEHLRGMFAFAIWDKQQRELFIARDRLGVKPLYYLHSADGTLYFASEIKAILAARPRVKAEINFGALPDYFANHATSGDETLFKGIKRLPPGHTLRWRDGQIEIKQYWDLHFAASSTSESDAKANGDPGRYDDAELVAQWKELFETSVRLRLMADVPLGMFLSGGIDSSAIAAVMSRMVSEPIKTFSVAFAEREANELEYARVVARAFNTEHHEVIVTPDEFFDALPRLVWNEDEPLAHPSSVALYFVSELAARHVKVVLTGEGSDEMLAGYARYAKTIGNMKLGAAYNQMTPQFLRALVRGRIDKLPVQSKARQKLQRTFLALPTDIESLYFDNFAVFNRARQSELFSSDLQSHIGTLDPYAGVRAALANTDARTPLNRLLYADTKTYLHELLMKQDQMSMAASIESRVPFLDHKLVEFSARLPERMKLRRGLQTKYVLREAMRGVLPDSILNRPKMGFPTPVGNWFRTSHRGVLEEYVTGERARARGFFDETCVREIVHRHTAGAEDHTERLWSLVNFEMWLREFIDGDTRGSHAPQTLAKEVLVSV